jgi:hypothetical protein
MPLIASVDRRIFDRHQYGDLGDLLLAAGAVRVTDDGFAYLDETVSPEAVRLYGEMTRLGYSKGWL